jgi:hypothetical protein
MQAMTSPERKENHADATPPAPPQRALTPEAARALAEASERRAAIDARAAEIAAARERQGRGGLEPVRYDDWEIKGIAVDF